MKRFQVAEGEATRTPAGTLEPQVNEVSGAKAFDLRQDDERVARPRILARRAARAARRAIR